MSRESDREFEERRDGDLLPARGPESVREWAEELVVRAREDGVALTGEGGLLTDMVRNVLQAGLEVEMAEHLGTLRAAFALQPGQCGAILSIDGRPSCLDYVSRPDAFARLHGKLLDGYLLDPLARTAPTGAPSEPEAFLTSLGTAA